MRPKLPQFLPDPKINTWKSQVPFWKENLDESKNAKEESTEVQISQMQSYKKCRRKRKQTDRKTDGQCRQFSSIGVKNKVKMTQQNCIFWHSTQTYPITTWSTLINVDDSLPFKTFIDHVAVTQVFSSEFSSSRALAWDGLTITESPA